MRSMALRLKPRLASSFLASLLRRCPRASSLVSIMYCTVMGNSWPGTCAF